LLVPLLKVRCSACTRAYTKIVRKIDSIIINGLSNWLISFVENVNCICMLLLISWQKNRVGPNINNFIIIKFYHPVTNFKNYDVIFFSTRIIAKENVM